MNSARRRTRHLREYRADHPNARENRRQLEMLRQTVCVLSVHLDRGTWPSKEWMLGEAQAPSTSILRKKLNAFTNKKG